MKQADLDQNSGLSATTAIISNDITWIKGSLAEIKDMLKSIDGNFLSRVEFTPIHDSIIDYHRRVDEIQKTIFIWIGALMLLSVISPILLKIFFKI